MCVRKRGEGVCVVGGGEWVGEGGLEGLSFFHIWYWTLFLLTQLHYELTGVCHTFIVAQYNILFIFYQKVLIFSYCIYHNYSDTLTPYHICPNL